MLFKSIFSKKQIDTLESYLKSKEPSFKYSVLLTQDQVGILDVSVLENSFPEAITITKTGTGTYDIDSAGNAFVGNKTSFFITNNNSIDAFFEIDWFNPGKMRLKTYLFGVLADNLMYRVPIKIEVYK